jgi:hypothetical protein
MIKNVSRGMEISADYDLHKYKLLRLICFIFERAQNTKMIDIVVMISENLILY